MAKRANGEGSILKDGERWRAAITTPDGRRLYKRFTTRADAAAWLAGTATDMKRGKYVAKNNITVGEWVKEYLAVYAAPRLRPRTLERYLDTAKHLAPINNIPIQALTAPEVQSMLNGLALKLGGSSLIKVYALLARAIKKALILRLLSSNIMDAVERPRYEQPDIEIFTRDELSTLLDVIAGNKSFSHYYLFFRLAILTGARLGELLALRRSSIGDDRIFIRASMSPTTGGATELPPKTRAGRREITVSPAICRELKQRASEGKVIAIDPYVFHTSSGRPISTRNIQDIWANALKNAGLPHRHFHALRHTHATELLAAGAPILEVSKRLGHTRASQTLDMYGHAIAGLDAKISDMADSLFGEGK